MKSRKRTILDVYPGRAGQQIVADSDSLPIGVTTRHGRRSGIGGPFLIQDNYLGGNPVSYESIPSPSQRLPPTSQGPASAPVRIRKKYKKRRTKSKVVSMSRGKKKDSKLSRNEPSPFTVRKSIKVPQRDDNAPTLKRSKIEEELDEDVDMDDAEHVETVGRGTAARRSSRDPDFDTSDEFEHRLVRDIRSPSGESENPAESDFLPEFNDVLGNLEDALPVAASAPETMYESVQAVYVNGKIAIEHKDGFGENVKELISQQLRTLPGIDERDSVLVPQVLEFVGWKQLKLWKFDSVEKLREFYEKELQPAIANFKIFLKMPHIFVDPNAGQYERFVDNGIIVELPLPPCPEIFPHQMEMRIRRENEEREAHRQAEQCREDRQTDLLDRVQQTMVKLNILRATVSYRSYVQLEQLHTELSGYETEITGKRVLSQRLREIFERLKIIDRTVTVPDHPPPVVQTTFQLPQFQVPQFQVPQFQPQQFQAQQYPFPF